MSDGVFHAKVNTVWALTVTGGGLYYLYPVNPIVYAGTTAGAWWGILLTPDIDHHKRTKEEARMYKLARPIGKVWQAFWSPYAVFFNHRGISHWFVIGTLTRLIYILFWCLIFLLAWIPIREALGWDWIDWRALITTMVSDPRLQTFWGSFLIGWMSADSVHIITDHFSTKRVKRRNRKARSNQEG